jgi:hypothetical protein
MTYRAKVKMLKKLPQRSPKTFRRHEARCSRWLLAFARPSSPLILELNAAVAEGASAPNCATPLSASTNLSEQLI